MIVVVGSYNQDLVWRTPRFPKAGETRTGQFSQGPGGKGFNQAMAAHRLGCATVFIAAIGDDAMGDNAKALAAVEELDCSWQLCPETATGNAAIWLDDTGQNRILVDLAANRKLSPAHTAANAEAICSARILLLQQEANRDASLAALHIAKAADVRCIVNPAPYLPDDVGLSALADILTPNESEFAALLSAFGEVLDAEAIATMGAESLHRLALKLPCPDIVITLGQRGALLSTPSGFHEFMPPLVTVTDTTGAGDCFNGALAAELARGASLPDACAFAVKAASCKVERAGAALAMPTRADIRARFPG
jgi:ribokinase